MDKKNYVFRENAVKLHELTDTIWILEKSINPPLSTLGIDIKEYAEKLIQNADVITIEDGGKIIAVAAFYANDYEEYVGFLSFIAVHDDFARKGIGTKLLLETEKVVTCRGMKRMRLEVFKTNLRAIYFYKKMGYREVMIKDSNSLIMEKFMG